MQAYTFHFGMVDPQSFYLPNSQPFGLASVENMKIGTTGELLLRRKKEKITDFTIPSNEKLLNATMFFKGYIVFVTQKDNNAYFYFFDTNLSKKKFKLTRTKATPTVIVKNTIRLMELSTNATFKNNNTITKADKSILLISGSDKLYYIKDPVNPTIKEYVTTPVISNPLDTTVMQARLWVINSPDTTETNKIWGSEIGKIDNYTTTSSPATTGFNVEIVAEKPEDMYTITPSQRVLLITTSNGVRLVRSRNELEGITAANVEQALTSSLACLEEQPIIFYSRFFLYSTRAGLFFKEVNLFEEKFQGVQDTPVHASKGQLHSVGKLFGSRETASFFYEVDGTLISAGFMQNSTVPFAFNYTLFFPKRETQEIHHYFPDEGYLIELTDNGAKAEILKEYDYPPTDEKYILKFYYLKDTTNITLNAKYKGTDPNHIHNIRVLSPDNNTEFEKTILFHDTDTHVQFTGNVLANTELGKNLYIYTIEIQVSPNIASDYSFHAIVLDP